MPLGSLNDLVTDVHCEADRKVAATAQLNYTLPWSTQASHGPDSLIPLAHIATKILRPGEKIAELKRASWRKIMNHWLNVEVIDTSNGAPTQRAEDTACDGTFLTTQGRTLTFSAKPKLERPIRFTADHNSFASGLLEASAPQRRIDQYAWRTTGRSNPPLAQALLNIGQGCPGLGIGTVSEMACIGIQDGLVELQLSARRILRQRVLIGINGVREPDESALDALSSGVTMDTHFDYDNVRKGRTAYILPFTCKLNFQPTPITGAISIL